MHGLIRLLGLGASHSRWSLTPGTPLSRALQNERQKLRTQINPQESMPKEETPVVPDPEWCRFNRAKWDELVAVHLAATGDELTALRTGQGRLKPIEEAELGSVQGLRILHLSDII